MEKRLAGIIYNEELYNLDSSDKPAKLVVVVSKDGEVPEMLLDKILGSIGHSRQDTTLIKSSGEFDFSELSFQNLISFGVRLKGIDFKPYSAVSDANRLIILSEPLAAIDADSSKEKKKKLWELLKTNFT